MSVNLKPLKTLLVSVFYAIVVILSSLSEVNAMTDDYSLYITRHAEKAEAASNPPLSEQGQRRAEMLAQLLAKANIEHIYSTPYQRTEATAGPLAQRLNVSIESYRAGAPEQLVALVQQRQRTSLIVGHSNTVPALVRAFGGVSEDLTEQDYGDLYQLNIRDGHVQLVRLMVPVTEELKN